MRKRRMRKMRPAGHLITPTQLEQLTMPIHMAVALLPLGYFTETHACDLAACLGIAQLAAEDARRPDIVASGARGSRALIAIRDRQRAGQGWQASDEDLAALRDAVTDIDQFFRRLNTAAFCRALARVNAMSEAGRAAGLQSLDVVKEVSA